MALHFLHVRKGINGVAAKSVGTSNFVNAIAGRHGIPVRETRVGFKNFRPYLLRSAPERAIVAFEESDGISAFNHTLEKDALFGLLLAVEMMARKVEEGWDKFRAATYAYRSTAFPIDTFGGSSMLVDYQGRIVSRHAAGGSVAPGAAATLAPGR